MKRIDRILATLQEKCRQSRSLLSVSPNYRKGFSAQEIAASLQLDRTNVSRDLNLLYAQGKVDKIPGKPALFFTRELEPEMDVTVPATVVAEAIAPDPPGRIDAGAFATLIGANGSLHSQVKQAQAAVLYPPHGLHTLLLGETGVGKSMFAEIMYRFAVRTKQLSDKSPFVSFNCADYASNPQLLLGQLFGVVKGAYTGAEKDRSGLIEKANGGILFLDEVHRLPPEGQEMLFYLMDRGFFRRLGETEKQRPANILILAATTENPTCLLHTFFRRIPMVIRIPSLLERPFLERLKLIELFFLQESTRIDIPIRITADALRGFCSYDCPGNIGQLRSDIQLSCAGAFLECIRQDDSELRITLSVAPQHVKNGLFKVKRPKVEVDYFLNQENQDLIISGNTDFPRQNRIPPLAGSFYDLIEQRYQALRLEGLSDDEIYNGASSPAAARVGILVVAHGHSAARAMAEVANHSLGVEYAHAIDVPLDHQPETILIAVEETIRKIDTGKGVLLLVDMGFLLLFGEIITSRTGIPVATAEMVSTPMVLEAVRKAYFGRAELAEVAQAVVNLNPCIIRSGIGKPSDSKRVILTVCLTGEGSGLRLKELLEDCLPELAENGIEVRPVSLIAGTAAPEPLQNIASEKELLAVVGAFNPNLGEIPFFSTESIIAGTGLQRLRLLIHGLPKKITLSPEADVSRQTLLNKMEATLAETMRFINPHLFLKHILTVLARLETHFSLLDNGRLTGFILHAGAILERKIQEDQPVAPFPARRLFLSRYARELDWVSQACSILEKAYSIRFCQDDCCFLLQIIIQEDIPNALHSQQSL
ncbi:phosphotransferase system mannose-type iia component [Lucifera butyrica]|uniref:Phosphotransferase system mannose-type iia component n=1 Tax=Lucifera butyrica TaxID=1351585 RepID=A0A498R7E7_9FIRM|nr:sigma-54-dependent transcriptional regulator [Lucifera butyrica]VBB06905.1 phosphotransferase system mannose-type iia component [Lucifera butyrica]